jgi:hypothetical protein
MIPATWRTTDGSSATSCSTSTAASWTPTASCPSVPAAAMSSSTSSSPTPRARPQAASSRTAGSPPEARRLVPGPRQLRGSRGREGVEVAQPAEGEAVLLQRPDVLLRLPTSLSSTRPARRTSASRSQGPSSARAFLDTGTSRPWPRRTWQVWPADPVLGRRPRPAHTGSPAFSQASRHSGPPTSNSRQIGGLAS